MSKAIKRYLKCADWLGRPKWFTDPNWTKDEAAVNDWYETIDAEVNGIGNRGNYPAIEKARAMSQEDFIDLTHKYNLYTKRHTPTSMKFLNQAKDILTPEEYQKFKRIDRDYALGALNERMLYMLTPPADNMQLTTKGKKLQKLHDALQKYFDLSDEERDSEPVPKNIADLYKPTPYQLKHWKEKANENGGRARRNALIGAGIGGGIGALSGLGLSYVPANDYTLSGKIVGTSDAPVSPWARLALTGVFGGLGAGIGGLAGYFDTSQYDRHRKQYAKKRLSEYE